jgi:catechol 2,3-dioxygenase-like lactoylglutathione lyase family enzyme
MITAVHTLVYAKDADAARTFFRDVLNWPYVDAHEGWLIFRTGPSEMGVHPASGDDGRNPGAAPGAHHEISLMCDDIEQTVAELKAKGVVFAGDISARGFGLVAMMKIPGAGEMMLYQPRHPLAHDL